MKMDKKKLVLVVLASIIVSAAVALLANFLMGGITGTDDSFIPYMNWLW